MCYTLAEISQFFSAFLTPIIALIAVYIAYQQWRLRQEHFQLELFDKRYKVYEGTKKFISIILEKGYPDENDISEFQESTHDATFLFENEVQRRLDNILEKGNKLNNINTYIALTEQASPDSAKEAKENEADIQDWFNDEYDRIKNLFMNYLKINS